MFVQLFAQLSNDFLGHLNRGQGCIKLDLINGIKGTAGSALSSLPNPLCLMQP